MSHGILAVGIQAVTCLLFSGCDESGARAAEMAEAHRAECLDRFCEGDVRPRHDNQHEVVLKFNGHWFIGPREYFSTGINGAMFLWWERKPLSRRSELPREVLESLRLGNGAFITVELFMRSNRFPLGPHGYRLIELAESNGWIAERKSIRRGLERVQMKHVVGPAGHYLDHVAYYVATETRGMDGLPAVATCNHDDARNSGGTGFVWRDGVWVGATWNQRHCEDWPEIYREIVRVLGLLRRA